MKTKVLLLMAVLSVAGFGVCLAQTFSTNVVGIVTKTIPARGYALISNPLIGADNSINALFRPVPPGTSVFRFDPTRGSYVTATFDELEDAFLPVAAAAAQIFPGEGVFVRNPTDGPITIVFVGEVPQGELKNPIPKGLSIRSSQVPQEGTAKELGFIGQPGDSIFKWDTTAQTYRTSTFDDLDNDWVPRLTKLEVGEAFFLSRRVAGSWDRKFSVNE